MSDAYCLGVKWGSCAYLLSFTCHSLQETDRENAFPGQITGGFQEQDCAAQIDDDVASDHAGGVLMGNDLSRL